MVVVVNEEEYDNDDGNDDETALTLAAATRRPMCVVSTTASLRCFDQEVSLCHQIGPFGMAGGRLRAQAAHNRKRQRGRARPP